MTFSYESGNYASDEKEQKKTKNDWSFQGKKVETSRSSKLLSKTKSF